MQTGVIKLMGLLAGVAACYPAPAAAQQAGGPVKVVSFNIRYGTAADGPDVWPNRRAQVIALLERLDADVIGLQEALRFQLDELRQGLSGYDEFGVGRDDGVSAGEHAAIFWRRDRFALVEGGTFWFSDTPETPGSMSWGNRITRIATWVRLREMPSGRTVRIYNVHLDHESQPSRERSVALLLRRIAADTGARRDPVIVTGDFNAGEDNPAVMAMVAAGFRDTWRVLNPGAAVAGTFNSFRGDSTGAKIDYVFVESLAQVTAAAIVRDNQGGRYPSDHYPVSAAIRPWDRLGVPTPPARRGDDAADEDAHGGELDAITVSATRVERRIEDQVQRVEVVGQEEVEEKLAMTPGDVAMLLNETGGLRVHTVAPSLGAAGVRVHGLPGRHTQLLADGLPIYGPGGSLGLLQIPPMDLRQVEIVKGAASANYGGGGLGGLINFVSRLPTGGHELLLNGTTLGGADAVYFGSGRSGERQGWTLLAGLHRQGRADRDDDGWTDVAGYERLVLRPRLFLDNGAGRSLFGTVGVMLEDREGGTARGGLAPDGQQFAELLTTRRFDAGLSGRSLTRGGTLLAARGALMVQRHEHVSGALQDSDRHLTGLAEATVTHTAAEVTQEAGLSWQHEQFRSDSVPRFDESQSIAGVFVHADWTASPRFGAHLGARLDGPTGSPPQLSPLASMRWVVAPGWSLRVAAAGGFRLPTPLTEEVEEITLRRVDVYLPSRLERGWTASADLGALRGPLEVNLTAFVNQIRNPLVTRARITGGGVGGGPIVVSDSIVDIRPLLGRERSWGLDAVLRWRRDPLVVTGSWTWLRGELQPDAGPPSERPFNPRHSGGLVGMYEGSATRVGVELYYTGRQTLDDNAYRTESRPYVVVGLLVQRDIGMARVFVNFENITDARLTRYHPLVNPAYTAETGWTTGAWAPLEGRVVNAGVRLRL